MFSTGANFDKGVQKAQDEGNRGEQGLPRQLGGAPAIRIDRDGLVVSVNGLRFRFEGGVAGR